jgi:hypothetical protein
MKSVSFVVTMATIMALLVGTINQGEHSTFATNKGAHSTFATNKGARTTFATNKGINLQTSTTQDQGCEPAGGTSGITNACTATSTPGSGMQTTVSLFFASCGVAVLSPPSGFQCSSGGVPVSCSNIGCTNISCNADLFVVATANCITNNGVQLTSCTGVNFITCTRTEPGTGISSSGGITGSDGG